MIRNSNKKNNEACDLFDLCDLNGALEILNEEVFLNDLNEIERSEIRVNRGIIEYLKGEYLDSLHNFRHAIRINEDFQIALYHRAQVTFLMGDYESALIDINRSLDLKVDLPSLLLRSRIRYEFIEPKDKEGAVEDLERCIEFIKNN